jgi:hypothetical protein
VIVDCGAAWRATGSVAFVRDGKVGFFFLSFVLAGSAPSLSFFFFFNHTKGEIPGPSAELTLWKSTRTSPPREVSLSFSLFLSLSLSASSIF